MSRVYTARAGCEDCSACTTCMRSYSVRHDDRSSCLSTWPNQSTDQETRQLASFSPQPDSQRLACLYSNCLHTAELVWGTRPLQEKGSGYPIGSMLMCSALSCTCALGLSNVISHDRRPVFPDLGNCPQIQGILVLFRDQGKIFLKVRNLGINYYLSSLSWLTHI